MQITANNPSAEMPLRFYYVPGNLPVDIPTETRALDGIDTWDQ